jgi:rare lipoprotein A
VRAARIAVALTLAALLAACGTAEKRPSKPATSSTGGGYYQDDGPGSAPPADIAAIPDAVPRDEAPHRFANRPYQVFGRSYVPMLAEDAYRERGVASWYGRKFHGQKTASGEVYDMYAMTAAHKTLPIPSYVRVTNPANGRSVLVRVNDRGPFVGERIIDLSWTAASKLGIVNAGSAPVEVERVFARGVLAAAKPAPPALPRPAPSSAQPVAQSTPQASQARTADGVAAEGGGFTLQLGAFASRDNAEAMAARAARELTWLAEPLTIVESAGLHRVRLGPYRQRLEADAIAAQIEKSLGFAPALLPGRAATPTPVTPKN